MKNIIATFTVMILSTAIVLCLCNSVPAKKQWDVISTAELKQILEQKQDYYLINVLPKIIHDAMHIPGSINIPLGKIEASPQLPTDKKKHMIFYCMGTL